MKKVVWIFSLATLAISIGFTGCEKKKAVSENPQVQVPLTQNYKPDTTWQLLGNDTSAVKAPTGTLEITTYGPQGETQGQVQIKIDFPRPLIPLTTLSDERREAVLRHFDLNPRIDGHFRIVGTSTVVFEPTHSLPMATDYTVTVTRGLRDMEGYELANDFSWKFSTPLPQISIFPENNRQQVNIDQEIHVRSSIPLDLESLREKARIYETVSGKDVPYQLLEDEKNPSPEQDIGMQRIWYDYILKPDRPLNKDTQYTVKIESGLMTYRGNRPLPKAILSNFRTFPPFRFVKGDFTPGCGGHLKTRPYMSFTTRPDYESVKKNIIIEPKTEEFPFYMYGYGDNTIGINDYMLQPKTTYTVVLNENLKDIYGQTLENPSRESFTTGDLTPKMWGPEGYQIITPNIEPVLGIKTVNIPVAFYQLMPLSPGQVMVREQLNYEYTIRRFLQRLGGEEKKIDISLNEEGIGKSYFDLKPYLKGENYGVVGYIFHSPQVPCYTRPIEFNGLILRTNLGIFTEFLPTSGIIKINRLTDGLPLPGTRIRLYREDDLPRLDKTLDKIAQAGEPTMQPCAEGITDENGLLILQASQMAKCTRRRITNKIINELYPPEADPNDILYDRERFGFAEPPSLLIIAENGDDWTFLQTTPYGNPSIWQFGVMSDWEGERPISRGTIFSDRYIYRPGETVKMKGVARYLLYGKLMSGEGQEYTIKLRDPQGAQSEIGKAKVNEFGTFTFDVPTKDGQLLGYYQVTAETPSTNLNFYGEFRLAEFRVPEFEVSMQIDRKTAAIDEPIKASWDGKFYFGAPMANASASLAVTRRQTSYSPPGWDTYDFGVPSYLEEKKISLSGTYLKESSTLNEKGQGEKVIKLRSEDVPFPMTYNFDVEVEDVSKQTVSASKSLTVLPYDQLVGIKLSNWIVAREKEITVSVIVASPQGKLLNGIPVKVSLIKREYHSVKTETPDGRFTTEHSVVRKVIETKEVNTSDQPVDVSLIPPEAGSYMILAELKKKPDSGTAAASSLWVSGHEYVPWEDRGEDRLEIIMDKKEYQIGDEAIAFIQSPFPEADLFFTVCREKIFLRDTRRITGSAYTYSFTVTEDMLPNAYVGAALFRVGQPIVPVEEEVGKHMERIGFAGFQVSLDSKYLKVQVEPDREKARPAEEVDVQFKITDAAGKGHHSELTVMVVDEAVLALTGYSPPDLVKTVYAFRGLSARINDNRPFVINKEELLQKGTGYGGGVMAGIGDTRIRKEFLKLAYYNPSLVTDPEGNALISIKMPDNLTTWRIMAVAVGDSNLFGYGDKKLVVTQPFILRPILPRFARLGDQFYSGVAITNLTEGGGEVSLAAQLGGNSVILQDKTAVQKGIRVKPGESRAVLFPFAAKLPGSAAFTFTASFNGIYNGKNISESDALQLPLTIEDLVATETVVSVGETQDQFSQQLDVTDNIRNDVGGLDISLSSTALTNIGEGAKYLVEYPYGCLEQTVSRLLALMQLKFLSDKYNFSLEAVKPVDKVIEANIRKVLLLQNSDGGFKFWTTSDESSCYLSPYVAYLFRKGRILGYKFPQEVSENLAKYLDRVLRNPCYQLSTWKALAEYRIRILLGLHYLGRFDETYFEEYFNRRNELSYGAQISLALLLWQSPDWQEEARKMLTEIKNGLFITAQTAHLESPAQLPPSWVFMSSPVITTSEAIKLFLEMEPENPLIAKFARYILNARKNGRWRYTYENAKAIDALVDISLKREAQPPDYTAKVMLAGNEVLSHMFKGYQYAPVNKSLSMIDLPAGSSDILVSMDGKGRLYYILSYSYHLKGAQQARQEGFSISRTVKNRETGKTMVTFENEPPAEINFKAGDVLEIELSYNVPQAGYHLVIDDPLPAGCEAIDASLKTTSARYETEQGMSNRYTRDWNYINHTEMHDDRVAMFADMIPAGIYTYRYLVRATTSGTFLWPAARVSLMYEPEQFGTCAEGFITIEK
jgi:uncharacterized protein YfaS (alpha-2-macroglobulin family)